MYKLLAFVVVALLVSETVGFRLKRQSAGAANAVQPVVQRTSTTTSPTTTTAAALKRQSADAANPVQPVVQRTSTTTAPTTTTAAAQTTLSAETNQCIRDCPVTAEYNPVCGSDRVLYPNPGRLLCAQACGVNVTQLRFGLCPTN